MFIFVFSIISVQLDFIAILGKSHNKTVGSIVHIDQIPSTFINLKK